ncbi:MAG: PAS domain S-box protein [Pirellulaceae bacterium]|nr:PAS domain S-box protein [Pirellulaceae bacterium]
MAPNHSLVSDWKAWQRAMVECALDCVVIIDAEGRVVDFNLAAEKTFGYKKEDIIGKRIGELIVPMNLREAHQAGLTRLRETGIKKILGRRLELPAIRSDGSQFDVELIVSMIERTEGPLYIGYIRDISERKSIENSLRKSEARFRNIADNAPVMIWLTGREHSRHWFNRVWLEFVGKPLDKQVEDAWLDGVHPDDLPNLLQTLDSSFEQGIGYSVEYRLRHHDGSYRWILDHGKPGFEVDGDASSYSGSCIDITKRREAEEQLRVSKFSIDRAGEAVFWIAPNATFVYVNDEACRSLGYTRDELLEMSVFDVIPSTLESDWADYWQRLKQEGGFRLEAIHKKKSGALFPVEVALNHIEFQGRELSCAFSRDITERRKHEQQLTQAMHEAYEANRAKSEFLALVSHEMRTPLNSILGMVELVSDSTLTDDQRELLTTCRQSGWLLKELIDDMLDYSQIQARKFVLQSSNFSLAHTLDRLHDRFEYSAKEKGLELRWEIDPKIPTLLLGDQRRLQQVIDNLLSNAIKFTQSGYVALEVSVRSVTERQICMSFTVDDTGIGVPEQDRTRIFNRFEQGDSSSTREFAGIGLGLSICSQVIQLMHGEIVVSDGPDGGARFNFTAFFGKAEERTQAMSDNKCDEDFKCLQGLHVLLVEDDPPSRVVATRMLEKVGLIVDQAHDGLQAVEKISDSAQKYDAVLLDMMLPRMDGVEVTARIRELWGDEMPIIALTAQVMDGAPERLLQAGLSACLAKPIESYSLLQTLASFLGDAEPRKREDNEISSTSKEILDEHALRTRCNQDQELVFELVELFAGTCRESIVHLDSACDTSNSDLLARAAHRLKGSLMNMCAPDAIASIQALELASKRADWEQIKNNVLRIKQDLQLLQVALRQLIED